MAKKKTNKLEEAIKRLQCKFTCLAHYGKGGHLQCTYKGCPVTDIDQLSLDHIEGDGNLNRLPGGRRRAGSGMYKWVIKTKFPKGLRTLCGSHQLKVELVRRRTKIK